MDVVKALFNIALMVFIVSTMLTAGFSTTFGQVRAVLSRVGLVALVLLVAFVVRPLVGWGTAELFNLATPSFIAMALLWSCPGAPIGAKLVIVAKGALQTGAVLQVLVALLGSITFAPTANAIINAANVGGNVSLPVGDLIKTVAFLQLVPFAVGILTRHWAPEQALEWRPFALKTSNLLFFVVLAGAVLGSWRTVIGLVGSKSLLAGIVATIVILVIGYVVAIGDAHTRKATAFIQSSTNAGPVFAAVAIAFDDDAVILGAITAILLLQIVVGLVAATYAGRRTHAPAPNAGAGTDPRPSSS